MLDGRICPLCRQLNGHILEKGTALYQRYRLPSHINCRRIMVDVHKDEVNNEGDPTRATLTPDNEPDEEMRRRYGHFIGDPKKYAPLRVPARPTGRDFIYERGADGAPGKLHWAPKLPKWALQETAARIGQAAVKALGKIDDALIAITLEQCAAAVAARGDALADHAAHDYAEHHGEWGLNLTYPQYWDIPNQVFDRRPGVAHAVQERNKYDGKRSDVAIFTLHDLPLRVVDHETGEVTIRHLNDVMVEWDV
ncbi:MAG: hypothetical protein AAB368_17055, partial [bacterium]